MKLPLPKHISFMNQVWSVDYATQNQLTDCVGLCDPQQLKIWISPNLAPDAETQTLLHEITHVMEMTLQLDLPERTVDLMAASFLHLLRSNPHLIESIFAVQYANPDQNDQ
jgi:hypothetical protein